jgi:pimeloyl-ACP methyl ester carboxylesterase
VNTAPAALSDEPTCGTMTINPHRPNGRTIVMTHGGWHTYTQYLSTFDHRPGWAYDFAEAGYRVVLADCPGTGTSPEVADPTAISSEYIVRGFARLIDSLSGPVDLLVHSMSGSIGVYLIDEYSDRIEHLVAVAPGQPADIAEQPEAVEDLGDTVRATYGDAERIIPKSGWVEGTREFVLRCIGEGRRFPAVDPDAYLATLSPIWAGLLLERVKPMLDPSSPQRPPIGDLGGTSVLVISGTRDTNHPRAVDQKLVDFLVRKGSSADLIYLGDIGIEGNGHMLMLEENSSQIASVILDWLSR